MLSFSCKYRPYHLPCVGCYCCCITKRRPKGMLLFCNPSFNFPGICSFHSIVLLVIIVRVAAVIGVCRHVYPRHTKKKIIIVICKFVTFSLLKLIVTITPHELRTNTRVHTSNIRVQKTKYGTGYIRIQWLHTNDTNA